MGCYLFLVLFDSKSRAQSNLHSPPTIFNSLYFKILLDLQEVSKNSRDFPYTFHPASPVDNILYKQMQLIIKARTLTLT